MHAHPMSCAGEVVLFELLAWLQEQEQYWRAEDAPDESCVPEVLCEHFNVPTPEATAAQAPCCDEASRAAFYALRTSAYSTVGMNQLCCIACHISRVIIIGRLFIHADLEYHHKRLSLHREEVCLPGELQGMADLAESLRAI